MLIICEGLDKTGKSTFVNKFGRPVYEALGEVPGNPGLTNLEYLRSQKLEGATIVMHLGPEDETPYHTMLKIFELAKHNTVVLDRSYISELAYGPVYRDELRIKCNEVIEIHNKLLTIPHIILFFKRDIDGILDALDNSYYEQNIDKVYSVYYNYNELKTILRIDYGLNIYEITQTTAIRPNAIIRYYTDNNIITEKYYG